MNHPPTLLTDDTTRHSAYTSQQPFLSRWTSHVAVYARRKMFGKFMAAVAPTPNMKVLDVGVTNANGRQGNFFEALYPYTSQITAAGLEDASQLEAEFPGLRYVKLDGGRLPFGDRSFDIVVSFAVLEHVGTRVQQREFLHELCRVGSVCFLSTPNRWFPIEVHTLIPFLHWLSPRWFRVALRLLGHAFYAEEKNLNLLSDHDVRQLLPRSAKVTAYHIRLFGFISNLVYFVQAKDQETH